MARHWRSRIALFLAHWTPSSPNSTAYAPSATPQYPPTQTSPPPSQSSPSDKSSIIVPPPPKPKPETTTTPSSVKVVSTDTPKSTKASPSGRGDRGIGGEGLRGWGGGKRKVREKPEKGRPNTWRKRTNVENPPEGIKRKRATAVVPVDVKEPQNRKHKKSRQALVSAFLRK